MIGVVIDTTALAKVVVASLIAGVGVTAVFSIGVYGAARSADKRRADRAGAATAYGLLAFLAVGLAVAAIAYGIVLTTQKS